MSKKTESITKLNRFVKQNKHMHMKLMRESLKIFFLLVIFQAIGYAILLIVAVYSDVVTAEVVTILAECLKSITGCITAGITAVVSLLNITLKKKAE